MKRFWAFAGLIALVGFGCSGMISRGKAKSLIQESRVCAARKAQFVLTSDELKDGVKRGYWQWPLYRRDYPGAHADEGMSLTPTGMKVFQLRDDTGDSAFEPLYFGQGTPMMVGTRNPIRREIIEVTGIADEPGDASGKAKRVEFSWQWDLRGLPSDAVVLLPNPRQSASVRLRLFDDGWRVD